MVNNNMDALEWLRKQLDSDGDDLLREMVREFAAKATVRAYRSDWAEFCPGPTTGGSSRCRRAPRRWRCTWWSWPRWPRPAPSTVACRRSARRIEPPGTLSPTGSARVQAVSTGIRRVHGAGVDQTVPITVAILRRMLEVAPPGLSGTRDRALLLVGFAGALRRSEIVALEAENLQEVDEGLVLTVPSPRPTRRAPGGPSGSPTARTC